MEKDIKDTKCCLCKDNADRVIKKGNPAFLGKPVCKWCDKHRGWLMNEEGFDVNKGFDRR